jgi:lysozyme
VVLALAGIVYYLIRLKNRRAPMKVTDLIPSDSLFSLLKKHEGLELKAYPDPGSPLGKAATSKGLRMRDYQRVPGWITLSGNPWTIGYGQTGGISEGMTITKEQAEAWLKQAVAEKAAHVRSLFAGQSLSQNQFDALVAFVYNMGPSTSRWPTLYSLVKSQKHTEAKRAFGLYVYAGGVKMPGLVKRRADEAALYSA